MNRNMTHRFQQCKDRFEHRDESAPPVVHVREPAEPILPEGWVKIGRLHYEKRFNLTAAEVYYSRARKSWSCSKYAKGHDGVNRYVVLPEDGFKSAMDAINHMEAK